MQRIIIVGGGAAGAAVVGEFLRHSRPGELDLVWLVGPRAPGRGIAYSTYAEHHLLNVRAAGMGLFADDVGAFMAHAQTQGWPVKGLDFVPRAWYGDYVESVLAGEISKARARSFALRMLSTDATSVRGDDATGYVVTSADGEILQADGVVLAIGGLPPEPLAEVSAAARASGVFSADPWHWAEPKQAPERVVVLGTGLTAVDVLQSAWRRWPNAQLTAISRHGQLPHAHNPAPGQPYERQAQLLQTLRAHPNVLDWLREIRATIAEEGTDWRALIDGLRGETQNLWRTLDLDERRRFLRHLRWMWESVRHRLPPQTTTEIARLRTQGRLKIIAGHVHSVDTRAGSAHQLDVRVRTRGTETTRSFAADFLVQATGFNLAASLSAHELVRQLVDDGVAQPDALDLGFAADRDGRLIGHDGKPAHGLRCLGSLLRGSVWECSGLPEIRGLAKAIVRDMPGELHELSVARRDSTTIRTNLSHLAVA